MMDFHNTDLRPGLNFSSKVRSLLGSQVTAPSPDDVTSFWLLPAFPRSCLKLTEGNVGFLLQSVLGGLASLFMAIS